MIIFSLALLIVFLLVIQLTGKWTNFENYLYSFPSKELSSLFSFIKFKRGFIRTFTTDIPQKKIAFLSLLKPVTITVSIKKYTTYYNNYFVAFNNIKLLV